MQGKRDPDKFAATKNMPKPTSKSEQSSVAGQKQRDIAPVNVKEKKKTRIIIPRIPDLKLCKGYIQATKVWKFVFEKHETVSWPNMNAEVRGQMSQCSICSEFQEKNPKERKQSSYSRTPVQ